jgi:hypothetical protein
LLGLVREVGNQSIRLRVYTSVVYDSVTCISERFLDVAYYARDCGNPPPSPPPPPVEDPLQYVDQVLIGTPPCETCPGQVCEGHEVPVHLSGVIRHSCYEFRRLEVLHTPVDPPAPPVVRVVFAEKDCFVTPCDPDSSPWHASVLLPGLPARNHSLRIQSGILVTCGNDSALTITGAESFGFAVGDSCGEPPAPRPPEGPCMWVSWGRPANGAACGAAVGPGQPARLLLGMRATTPIAGFQGKLQFSPYGLHIADIRPVNAAAGMRVLWNPGPAGASFVLFSETGQLLPPCNPLVDCIACCEFHSVLEVTVAVDDDIRFAPITELLVWEVIGADSLAHGVHACVRDSRDREAMVARLCADKPCEANHDGDTDVRDLVTMVRCVNDPAGCAASSAGLSLDCENDGDLDLADVICCAHFLLHGQLPDSEETVPAPTVRLRFGAPIVASDGVDVPVRLEGASRVAAARLGLDIPLERFDPTGVLLAGPDAQDWLALHEHRDASVAAGLVRIQSSPRIPEAPDVLEFTIRLTLKPGQKAGGQLWVVDGDYTGAQGEGLIPSAGDRSVLLGSASPVPELALARPQPNPFSHEVTLALSLAREADVELTVHDLTGRLVATVHRGRLSAGRHTFVWRGTRNDGAPTANGMYFVRARVAGRVLSQKLALLSGR